MKKLAFILLLAIFTLSGCATNQNSKKLIEIGGQASCIAYEIQNERGEKVSVPKEIQESLECITGAVKLSPDNNFLLYDHSNDLNLYNFDTENTQTLISLEANLEGISCIWNELGTKIACALINQQEYEGNTKFIVIELENGTPTNTKQYPITYETTADFVCGASCYPGKFWFEGENTLKYEGHNIVAPGEVFEIQF